MKEKAWADRNAVGEQDRPVGDDVNYVLYAEDNITDHTFFVRAFRGEKPTYPLVHLQDGNRAMEYLRSRNKRNAEPPVLVVADIKMPGLSGLELLEFIRQDHRLKYVPVIMLTASAEDRDLNQAYANHCNAYLVKPNQYRQLKKLVAALVNFWIRQNRVPA